MGGRPKFSFEAVKKTFEERGCKLLETEYQNDRTQLRYLARCGHERTSTFNNFVRGKGDLCRQCRYKKNGDQRALGEEKIKAAFEAEGCRVLNFGFRTNTDAVRYIALCGHENVSDYAHFISQKAGRVCNACSKSIRYQYDYVRERFEEEGCELLETEYRNCKTKMRYVAQCGHESTITFDAFLNSERGSKRCRNCQKITYHDVVEDRNRTASKVWRKAVYERDNFNCRKCGKHGGDLNAHHLFAYADTPALRFSVDNGVTLCPTCHTKFHMAYGFGGNTADQFQEWIAGNTEVIAETKESATP
jgi:5-methylcytosine-specific restriction endonuclease McrA